mgnify:CR=1 FL=1
MELLELKDKMLSLLDTDIENISFAINNVLKNKEEREKIFEKYNLLVKGDLETDNLQKIWQYYHADRKEKCQDYTPKSIAKLCAILTRTNGSVCYDLCAGSGALTIQKWADNKSKQFICEELDEKVFPLLLFNMCIRNMAGYAICRNALTLDFSFGYKLEKGKNFSEISEITEAPKIEADEVISNPPYNIQWDPPAPLFADSRFQKCEVPPARNANWAFVLTAIDRMSDFGKCAFILPCGFLSNEEEKEQRKWAITNGLIKKVIALPDGMFESTGIPTCVILFEKSEHVEFYDARKSGTKELRLQNGQVGSASHKNRTYKKELTIISDDVIDKLSKCTSDASLLSAIKTKDEIQKKDWILVPSRYIEYPSEEIEHRKLSEIMSDINKVSRERSSIKLTINETLAKQLGLYEIAELEKNSDATELNKTFNALGGKYISKQYIQLSKNKNEIKFESNDKEMLSSIFSILIPMWKQHVFYLNQQENILLSELRDAMLPDLMSGKICFSEKTNE